MKDPKKINDFINEVLAIEAQEAKEAGQLGFMARSLVQATLPHRKTEGNEFSRTNGTFNLSLLAPSKVGLPYGSVPRVLITWLTTEAVRTKERELILGDSLSGFMKELGMGDATGGRHGTITRLKEQLLRLFSCYISCNYTDEDLAAGQNLMIADDYKLWWTPKNPDQIELFSSTVTLSKKFFEEITLHPVPVDLRAIKALKRSPLALDIYSWLTYRMSYLRKPTVIPWEALELQFGSDYKLTRQFKAAFLEQLKNVHLVYPEAKVNEDRNGLLLKPSKTHVNKLGYTPVDKRLSTHK